MAGDRTVPSKELTTAAERLATAIINHYPDTDDKVIGGAVLRTLNVVAELMEQGANDIRFVALRGDDVRGWRALLLRGGERLPRIEVTVLENR